MSKFDNLIINDLKIISLDMIKEAGSGNSGLALNSASVFYSLFMNYLKYDNHNENWFNKDILYVNNDLLPSYYASKHLFGFDIAIDDLKEYKKLDSVVPGYLLSSHTDGDVIGYGVGTALGERYLRNLVKSYDNKSKLINYHTICVCTPKDILSGMAFETLQYASKEKLNNLIIIVINDKINENDNSIIDCLEFLDLNVINAKSNNLTSINDALTEAYDSKESSVILVDAYYEKEWRNNNYNRPLTEEELNKLKTKLKINETFSIPENHYEIIKKDLNKRLGKEIEKWEQIKNDSLTNDNIKKIIEFIETKEIKLNFNVDNIKINDNYEEDLLMGNSKIFNILANKSPYIISMSNSNYGNIKNTKLMNKNDPLERNINFNGNQISMGCIACGLAKLGFKVFVNAPLIDSSLMLPFIKYAAYKELDIHYIFTHDTFLNTYNNLGISATHEINNFRLIPKLITFRPADINEIIGVYNIIANYKKCTITIIGSVTIPKLVGTNPKYVVAGAYRIKREKGEANGIIIATGSEVSLALKVAEEVLPYGIDLRVVTMPSLELFANQSERYQYTLLPKELKTFVIEFGSTLAWHKYASGEEFILGLDRYSTSGTKEELLNKYNLDLDSIKTRIIELMKK